MWFPWGKLMAFWSAGKNKRHPEKDFQGGKKYQLPIYRVENIAWKSFQMKHPRYSLKCFWTACKHYTEKTWNSHRFQTGIYSWIMENHSRNTHTSEFRFQAQDIVQDHAFALYMVWHNTELGKKQPGKDVSPWILLTTEILQSQCQYGWILSIYMLIYYEYMKLQHQFRSCLEFLMESQDDWGWKGPPEVTWSNPAHHSYPEPRTMPSWLLNISKDGTSKNSTIFVFTIEI